MERVLCITKDDFLGLPRVKASLLQDPRGLPVKAALSLSMDGFRELKTLFGSNSL